MNNASYNVLLMGNGGVGKSVIVKDYLYNIGKDKGEFLYATTTFSAQTSSNNMS
jgi:predicted AAA+ superfamily ATPase